MIVQRGSCWGYWFNCSFTEANNNRGNHRYTDAVSHLKLSNNIITQSNTIKQFNAYFKRTIHNPYGPLFLSIGAFMCVCPSLCSVRQSNELIFRTKIIPFGKLGKMSEFTQLCALVLFYNRLVQNKLNRSWDIQQSCHLKLIWSRPDYFGLQNYKLSTLILRCILRNKNSWFNSMGLSQYITVMLSGYGRVGFNNIFVYLAYSFYYKQ